jgi:hypothetical protein
MIRNKNSIIQFDHFSIHGWTYWHLYMYMYSYVNIYVILNIICITF